MKILIVGKMNVIPISRYLSSPYPPIKELFLFLFMMSALPVAWAQNSSDSVYIQTQTKLEVVVSNKVTKIPAFSFASIPAPKAGSTVLSVNEKRLSITTKGSELILIDQAGAVKRFSSQDNNVEVQKVGTAEFSAYIKAARDNSKLALLEFIEKFPATSLSKPMRSMLDQRIVKEKTDALVQEMAQKNYDRATDILLSFSDRDQKEDTRIAAIGTELARYSLSKAQEAASNGNKTVALRLAKLSFDIEENIESKNMIASLEQSLIDAEYNEQVEKAKSLEASGDPQKALELYTSALLLKQSAELSEKIKNLGMAIEDNSIKFARTNDHDRTLIYYRIRNYEHYLSQYPDGRYADEAALRVKKLSKISGQLTRYFFTTSLIFWDDNSSGYQFRIGRFSEKNLFSIGTNFNRDVLRVRSAEFERDKEGTILGNELSYAAVPGYDYSKPSYITRGNVFISYSRLIGKPRVFQYYICFDLGLSYRYTYYPTYALDGNMLSYKPEAQPKLRRYSTEDGTVGQMFGLNFILNYKMLTMELGGRVDGFGVGYSIGAGLSF
jgi:hypothetical protein